jgi:septal ring factor EnvC (AmiA/AmiB activator)
MKIGNAEYFDNLNKEIKEKQSELSLTNSKIIAAKQIIAERDLEIKELREEIARNEKMWMTENSECMVLRRRIVKLGFNPTMASRMFVESFQSLENDPISEELVEIYNDPIFND